MQVLTKQELRELSGLKRPSSIAAWASSKGLHYLVGADGWPRISRAAVERLLDPPNAARHAEVDLGAMAEVRRRV